MRPYLTNIWPQVMFGEGASKDTGKKLAELGVTKVLAVYDTGVHKAGIVDPIIKSVENEGIEVVHFDKVQADPPDFLIVEATQIANKNNVNGVLAIGGGSSMDTAKVLSVYRHCDGPIEDYFDDSCRGAMYYKNRRDAVLILIPTTAGTGAEMTPGGVISDTKNNVKRSFGSPKCKCDLAILDPCLTVGLPKYITAITGLDALSHAIECMTGIKRSARTDMIDGQAVEYIWRSLPVVYENGSNIEARSEMLIAANIALAGDGVTNFGHGVATAMGGKLHMVHGHACAVVLPEYIRYVANIADRELRIIAKKMELNDKSSTVAEDIACAIEKMNKKLGIVSPKELGIEKEEFLSIVDEILIGQKMYMDRTEPTPTQETVKQFLLSIYE